MEVKGQLNSKVDPQARSIEMKGNKDMTSRLLSITGTLALSAALFFGAGMQGAVSAQEDDGGGETITVSLSESCGDEGGIAVQNENSEGTFTTCTFRDGSGWSCYDESSRCWTHDPDPTLPAKGVTAGFAMSGQSKVVVQPEQQPMPEDQKWDGAGGNVGFVWESVVESSGSSQTAPLAAPGPDQRDNNNTNGLPELAPPDAEEEPIDDRRPVFDGGSQEVAPADPKTGDSIDDGKPEMDGEPQEVDPADPETEQPIDDGKPEMDGEPQEVDPTDVAPEVPTTDDEPIEESPTNEIPTGEGSLEELPTESGGEKESEVGDAGSKLQDEAKGNVEQSEAAVIATTEQASTFDLMQFALGGLLLGIPAAALGIVLMRRSSK